MRNIIVLGDSFSYGEGCSDRPTEVRGKGLGPSSFAWPALLRKDFPDDSVLNLSTPGNSLIGMFRDVAKFRENVPQIKIDLVVASVTSFDRTIMANYLDPERSVTNWVISNLEPISDEEPKEYVKARESYLKYLVNDEVLNVHALIQLLGLIQFCQHLCGATILWSVPDPHIIMKQQAYFDTVKSLFFNHMYKFRYTGEELTESFKDSCLSHDGHPNDTGHLHYYEQYVKPVLVPKIEYFLK